MLFFYKTLQRKHGPPVQLLQPTIVPDSVCGLELDTGDDYWILGNGKGYAFLADAFACAAGLRQGQFIYIPVSMVPNKELSEQFPPPFNLFLDMVLLNYCSLTLSSKEVVACLASNSRWEGRARIKPMSDKPSSRKEPSLKRKLTVKRVHKHLIISANGDMLRRMSSDGREMVNIPDAPYSNDYPEHFHYDWNERTSRSSGMTLRYWYNDSYAC